MTEYDGSTTLTCDWRPDGMRAWKDNGSTTTYFYYDLRGVTVLEEQSGAITAINTFGPNGLVSRGTSSMNEVYYQFDERGDTVTRSDDSGAVLEYHGSDTFGDQFASGSTTDPYLGFGAQWGYYGDSEIGFFLLGHRFYDQGNARFLNRDPIGYAGGTNPYSYANNNPTDYADPSGDVAIYIVTYRVFGFGWHRGILVVDNVGGAGAYSFAGGPQHYGPNNNGFLVSKSGPWSPGAQDYDAYFFQGSGPRQPDERDLLLLFSDNCKSSYQVWVSKFKQIEAFIASKPGQDYAPMPSDFHLWGGKTVNSNTWYTIFWARPGS